MWTSTKIDHIILGGTNKKTGIEISEIFLYLFSTHGDPEMPFPSLDT